MFCPLYSSKPLSVESDTRPTDKHMEIDKEKIAYLPGLLARKLGIGKAALMNHLRKTGLIELCWRTKYSWRIPYEVALKIASPEILSGPPPVRQKRSARRLLANDDTTSKGQEKPAKPATAILPDYRQIGKELRVAGVTMADLIKYIEQQMEVVHEQSPYNTAKRDETGKPQTSGNTSSDISNSSAK